VALALRADVCLRHRRSTRGCDLRTVRRHSILEVRADCCREAEFHALFENSIRLNRTMEGMWIFRLLEFLMPKRAADMVKRSRAGVALLERTQGNRF
jgi:hypothetical protein